MWKPTISSTSSSIAFPLTLYAKTRNIKRPITALLFLTAMLLATSALGQVEYLRLSPRQQMSQTVGATNVEIDYSRPQAKGRVVFGGLVPFNRMWRTGANDNTKLSFSHKVRIGVTEVPSGTYALFTEPYAESWKIYFYSDTNNLDVPIPIDSLKLIFLTEVQPYKLTFPEETLTINIYDITETLANLGTSWTNTAVRVPITFYTAEVVEAMMSREFKPNALDYSTAATYYLERDTNLVRAKELQELSIKLRDSPSAWTHNSYAKILYKLEDFAGATVEFKRSLALAEETSNEYLVRENNRFIDELTKDSRRVPTPARSSINAGAKFHTIGN